MTFQWSFIEALSVVRKTYVEDWGKVDKDRAQFLQDNPTIIEIQNNEIMGLQAGQGRAVIFLHGSPANAMRWAQYLKNVPDGYQFISIDRMGFGARGQEIPDLENDYQIMKQFIQGFDNPILVAHSLGGAIALRMANDVKLKRLILIASSLNPALEKILWVQKLPVSKLLSRSIRHSNDEMLQLPKFMKRTEDDLKDITIESVVIHPKNDALVSHDNVAYAQKYLKNLTIIEPEEGGHFIPWTHPDLITKAIVGGLDD